MKILHIVSGNLTGGAARGAYWLHLGLKLLGIDSKIYINSRVDFSNEDIVSNVHSKKDIVFNMIRSQLDNILLEYYPKRKKQIFSSGIFGIDFTKLDEYKEADIIHLHWINNGFVNLKHLNNVDKPIVWTMRDMWPFTGGCHYSMGCENYKTGCGYCKQLGSGSKNDFSRRIITQKQKYLPKNMKLVGISNWISEEARKSYLFQDYDVKMIHNNISTEEFFPIDKSIAREILNIKTNKKIITIGSTSLNDFYKGFDKFLEATRTLKKDKYFLCFFGNFDKTIAEKMGFEYRSFGYLNDNISLRLVYSASDVFVAPSLMDAFGKTLAEAMACGTPIVCFDATGPKDIVTHKFDGYKAKPFDTTDLKEGIEWVLNSQNYEELCKNARKKVLNEFDSKVVAKKYIELYTEILSNKT